HAPDPPVDRLGKSRKVATFIPSTSNKPDRLIDTLQRFERGIDVRALRIIHKPDTTTFADNLKGMFEPRKCREDATNRVKGTSAQQGIGGRRHDIAHIVVADDTNLAATTDLLPNTGNRRDDPVAFEVGSVGHISVGCRRGRKPEVLCADTM